MDATALFQEALRFEEKIRDLYRQAEMTVDDPRGKAIFRALAIDEQSHVDFLHHCIAQVRTDGIPSPATLASPLPEPMVVEDKLAAMATYIPIRMLGDIKTVLNSALQMEKETSAFYESACAKTSGELQRVFEKFLAIENRHTELVRLELVHATRNGMWFDFMEVNLEAE